MSKKKPKNEVLYLDDYVAVLDFKGRKASGYDAVRWLLNVGTNAKDEAKPLRETLANYAFRASKTLHIQGIAENDIANPQRLRELGCEMSTCDGVRALDAWLTQDSGTLVLVDIPELKAAAKAINYVARLALLALGDERHAYCLELESADEKANARFVAFSAVVGGGIIGDYETASMRLDSVPFVDAVVQDGENARLRCSVFAHDYYSDWRGFPASDAERTAIAANVLLSVLLNLTAAAPYMPDAVIGLPTKRDVPNLVALTVELARIGKLAGCPHCGWPVAKLTPKADPYCRKSHRTRTDERTVCE